MNKFAIEEEACKLFKIPPPAVEAVITLKVGHLPTVKVTRYLHRDDPLTEGAVLSDGIDGRFETYTYCLP